MTYVPLTRRYYKLAMSHRLSGLTVNTFIINSDNVRKGYDVKWVGVMIWKGKYA